ncbi:MULTISPECIES: hypothetical protein [Oceanisphaera]|uniref:Elongation factor P C-terminal domain-containing protein n=1 Tax=Oceanisphaera ostreae TaxID=914151 RepID=A0ABW3KKE5_9GAMM
MDIVIIDTAPELKGASASVRTKLANFDSRLTISVPEHLKIGDKVRIYTTDKRYVSRTD